MTFRTTGLLVSIPLVTAGLCAQPALGLPRTLGYSFYVEGVPVGRTDIKITETAREIIFESVTHVDTGTDVIALTSKTVADRKTYEFRDFYYKGVKGDYPVTCQAQVKGDSVYGFFERNGVLKDKRLQMRHPRSLLFEEWIIDHEILLALTQAASPQKTSTYGLVFTSSFSPAEIMAGYSGEVYVEAGTRSMVARKLVIIIQGAEPFESHVDPVRGIPVYIRVPASQSEIFLDEVFGENPVTYFSSTKKD